MSATVSSSSSRWGSLSNWPPYAKFSRFVFASPRRQFWLLAVIPILWVLFAHFGPILQMLYVSFLDSYPPTVGVEPVVTTANYQRFFSDYIFFIPFFRTLAFATVLTFSTLIITYPVAYYLARHVKRDNQMALLLLLLIPFWVGEIVRTYAIMILLGNNGAVNLALKWFGLIERPIPFMYTGFSLSVGIIYLTSLYMLMPLYSALEKLPRTYAEAAADLGAGAWTRFWRVTLPLSREGIASGCTLVFLISTGYYATPVLLGGPSTTVFAETIAGFFHVAGDEWPDGRRLFLFDAAHIFGDCRHIPPDRWPRRPFMSRNTRILMSCIFWTFVVYLFVPLMLMVLMGFKDSKFIGFPIKSYTLDWYIEVFRDTETLGVFGYSLMIAVLSTFISLVIGTLIAAFLMSASFGAAR